MIRENLEGALYQFIKDRVIKTSGAIFHAIGGIETHIHLVTTVTPSLHLDEWVGQLNGASSHEFGKLLQWQTGYGVVSLGTKDLDWVINYVNNQRQHHDRRTAVERLERIVPDL